MELRNNLYVYNPLERDVTIKALGNYFTFKPKQFKSMRYEIASFIETQKKDEGLAVLDERFEDSEFRNSDEGKALLEAKSAEGINNLTKRLAAQIHNLQNSIPEDLRAKGIQVDANTVAQYATDGDLAALEELRFYQRQQKDSAKERANRAKQLLSQVNAHSSGLVNKKD